MKQKDTEATLRSVQSALAHSPHLQSSATELAIRSVLERAKYDLALTERLQREPVTVLRENGVALPDNIEIDVYRSAPNRKFLIVDAPIGSPSHSLDPRVYLSQDIGQFFVHHYYGAIWPVGFKGDDLWVFPTGQTNVSISASASDPSHGIRLTDNHDGTANVHWWFNAYLDISYTITAITITGFPREIVTGSLEIDNWNSPPASGYWKRDRTQYSVRSTW